MPPMTAAMPSPKATTRTNPNARPAGGDGAEQDEQGARRRDEAAGQPEDEEAAPGDGRARGRGVACGGCRRACARADRGRARGRGRGAWSWARPCSWSWACACASACAARRRRHSPRSIQPPMARMLRAATTGAMRTTRSGGRTSAAPSTTAGQDEDADGVRQADRQPQPDGVERRSRASRRGRRPSASCRGPGVRACPAPSASAVSSDRSRTTRRQVGGAEDRSAGRPRCHRGSAAGPGVRRRRGRGRRRRRWASASAGTSTGWASETAAAGRRPSTVVDATARRRAVGRAGPPGRRSAAAEALVDRTVVPGPLGATVAPEPTTTTSRQPRRSGERPSAKADGRTGVDASSAGLDGRLGDAHQRASWAGRRRPIGNDSPAAVRRRARAVPSMVRVTSRSRPSHVDDADRRAISASDSLAVARPCRAPGCAWNVGTSAWSMTRSRTTRSGSTRRPGVVVDREVAERMRRGQPGQGERERRAPAATARPARRGEARWLASSHGAEGTRRSPGWMTGARRLHSRAMSPPETPRRSAERSSPSKGRKAGARPPRPSDSGAHLEADRPARPPDPRAGRHVARRAPARGPPGADRQPAPRRRIR